MNKRIFTYTAMALLLGACADDDFRLPNGLGEDGSIELTLAVPSMNTVSTRATNEDDINTLKLLIFDSNDKLKQIIDKEDLSLSVSGTGTDKRYSVKAKIDAEIRGESDLNFYFIANYPSEITLEKEQDLALFTTWGDSEMRYNTPTGANHIRMSGHATLAELAGNNSVAMKRNSAKITVSDKNPLADDAQAYTFNVYGTASSALLFSGAMTNTKDGMKAHYGEATVANVGMLSAADDIPEPMAADIEALYVHPTRNDIDSQIRPFVIIQAPFEGTEYYYRVDFRTAEKDETGNITKLNELDITANHWYQFIVEEVTGKGATTDVEAAKAPSSLISVEIKDYTPVTFNMVTDGSRELGVNHELVYTGSSTDADPTSNLYVKLYSPDDSDYPDMSVEAFSKLLSLSDDWISIASVAEADAENEKDLPGFDGKGRVYRVAIQFNQTSAPGTLEGEILVNWKGLSREVPVIWKRDFDATELCDVKLYMKQGPDAARVEVASDYWTFLKESVEGVSAEANMGTARNEGLHFPLMYGEMESLWEYEYEVTYKAFASKTYDYKIFSRGTIINTEFTVGSTTGTEISGSNHTGNLVVTVKKPTNSWLYTYGEMVLAIAEPGTEDWKEYPLDLYHTGFFHDHAQTDTHRVGGNTGNKYYYYEVLGDGNGNYWLDRNLGAVSAGYCVYDSNGNVYATDGEASEGASAGGYYRVADNNDGATPAMYENLCPPGFQIPRQEIWNSVRNSDKFVKTFTGAYYNGYLISENGRRIHFPKVRYYGADDSMSGEARAGYYWSSTASTGFEKEQVGRWLEGFVVSGSVTSYLSCPVNVTTGTKGFAMNVRCVNKTSDSGNSYRINFSVAGATHVYIYNEVNGVRTAAYTWPGKAIGDYNTMTADQYMSFVYDSPTTPADQWYVIFNYKDANGQIHTFSKNLGHTTDKPSSELEGWKVKGEKFSDDLISTTGGKWNISHPTDDSASLSYSNGIATDADVDKYTYRIYWPYATDSNQWNGLYVSGSNGNTLTFGGSSYSSFPNEQNTTNAKYKFYSESFAFIEFDVLRKPLEGNITVQQRRGNGQVGNVTRSISVAKFEQVPGSKVYELTLDSGFTTATEGTPGYFFVYFYDLEGWNEDLTLNYGGSIPGVKLTAYWPVLYRFTVNGVNTSASIRIQGTTSGHSITASSSGLSVYGSNQIDGSYYNNGATNGGRNAVKPAQITTLGSGQIRVAVKQDDMFSSWNSMYVYDWGGTNPATGAASKAMTKLTVGTQNYFYRDIYSNATGFLLTNGAFGDQGGIQTNDIKPTTGTVGSLYKPGKLLQQWDFPLSIK